jgi:hypothetical protein
MWALQLLACIFRGPVGGMRLQLVAISSDRHRWRLRRCPASRVAAKKSFNGILVLPGPDELISDTFLHSL